MLHFKPKLWLDAANLSSFRTNLGVDSEYPTDGSLVGMWLDQSGGQYHAKAHFDENRSLSEFMPTYRDSGFNSGLPGLEFNSSMMVVENSAVDFDGWDELTVYAVVQRLSRTVWQYWFGKSETPDTGSNASWWFLPRRLDMNPSLFDLRFYDSSSSSIVSLPGHSNLIHQPGILVASIRGDSAVMKYNGTQVAYANRSTVLRNSPDIPLTIGAPHASHKSKFIRIHCFE